MSEEYYSGKGCKCAAHSAFECGCSGVDWTDPEVYRLRKENAALREAAAITDDYINQMLHGDIELTHGILQSWRNTNDAARKEAQP